MSIRNIVIDKSANLSIDIVVCDASGAPIDFTLYTANACYKTHADASNVTYMTTNGYSNGVLNVSLTGVETANISISRYMYEVYATHTASNTTSRVQEGIFTVRGGLC